MSERHEVRDAGEGEAIPLRRVEFFVCDLCLTAAGGECHVPGCAFWMQDAPVGSFLAWFRERRQVDAP